MRTWIFGTYSLGDEVLTQMIKQAFNVETVFVGSKVDLSKITPDEENIIVIINRSLLNMDLNKVMAYIKKDLSTPLVVVKKLKTFGAIAFEKNLEIKDIFTNKIYIFSGILYVPKKYMRTTISEIFRDVNKKELRVFFDSSRRTYDK